MIIVVWPLSTKVKPLNCNSFFFFTHLCESDSFNLLIFCFLVNYLSLILCTTFCTWWLLRFYNQGQIRRLCLGRAGRYVEHFDLHAWLLTSWISSCWLLNGSYCHYMFSILIEKYMFIAFWMLMLILLSWTWWKIWCLKLLGK